MRALRFAVWASAVGVAMIHGAAFASVREERVAPLPTAPVHGQSTSIGRSGVSSCDRWRALAARLGETHAGHKLRHLLTTRLCVLTEDTSDEVWAWPWRFSDVRADLPPQHHGKFGAWDIRCDQAGQRRRCALSLETSMVLGGDPSRPIRIVSHVVIDAVAGRESVLWRVHVPRSAGGVAAEAGIAVDLGYRNFVESFDACGPRGCMAEAEPVIGAEVASALWQGRQITMRLIGAGGLEAETGMLPAQGFRAGLKELIRLRRHEARTLAER